MHLEILFEDAPDAEPDEGVAIDHKAVWTLAQDASDHSFTGSGPLAGDDPIPLRS
jgi:hypothetical protein